jgi:hypothetical protein
MAMRLLVVPRSIPTMISSVCKLPVAILMATLPIKIKNSGRKGSLLGVHDALYPIAALNNSIFSE